MMNLKRLYAFLVVLLIVVPASAQTCDLTQKIMSLEGRMDTTFYTYEKKSHWFTEILRPQPEGGHLREIYKFSEGRVNAMEATNFRFEYIHDDQDRVIGFNVFDDMGVRNFYYALEYDTKGRLVKHTGFETPSRSDTIFSETTLYHYEGDKMVKMEEYNDLPDGNTPPTTTTTFEYDDHVNPEYFPMLGSNRPFKYMVTKQMVGDANGIYDPYSFTRECTYDKKGYPVKCVSHYLDGSETVESYTYKCK